MGLLNGLILNGVYTVVRKEVIWFMCFTKKEDDEEAPPCDEKIKTLMEVILYMNQKVAVPKLKLLSELKTAFADPFGKFMHFNFVKSNCGNS